MGSLVGQTEANIRQALQAADAMAPAILFIDEIEKGLAGAASGGRGDSGVSSRLFGTMLTWLNDHGSDVFTIATCNNIKQLPPEFSRAERFDAIMFLDLPGPAERESIWAICRSEYAIDDADPAPKDEGWTGAEIKACCRLSVLLGINLQRHHGISCRWASPPRKASRSCGSGRQVGAWTQAFLASIELEAVARTPLPSRRAAFVVIVRLTIDPDPGAAYCAPVTITALVQGST